MVHVEILDPLEIGQDAACPPTAHPTPQQRPQGAPENHGMTGAIEVTHPQSGRRGQTEALQGPADHLDLYLWFVAQQHRGGILVGERTETRGE